MMGERRPDGKGAGSAESVGGWQQAESVGEACRVNVRGGIDFGYTVDPEEDTRLASRTPKRRTRQGKTTRRTNVRTTAPARRGLMIVSEVPDRAMVIFAHPDDAEIASGGVIARWVAAGCEVTYVLCTNGAAGTADRGLSPEALAEKRAAEQRAAADFMGVKHLVMLNYPDGGLEASRDFLGDVVRAIRTYRPHTVFAHDPHRIKGFQHRDHRMVGIVATDAVYPFARDHLHFNEQIAQDGLEPHKVRELWYWGADEPEIIVDVTASIDRQIDALVRHESQVPGFNVASGQTIGERLKASAAAQARGYRFKYGATFRRLVARA